MGFALSILSETWEGVAALFGIVRKWFAFVALFFAIGASPAYAQFGGTEATAVRDGWTFPPGEVNILVFRPEVRVGSQAVGGMHQPRADWTETAKANIYAALREEQLARGTQFVLIDEAQEQHAELLADYSALFRTVANAAFQHKLFPGNRLPTKKRDFDWTLGDEASALRDMGGDFGLFLYTYDSYGSTGRKILQILGAAAGVGLIPSGQHVGYAGLVDLRNGDLVWLNVDIQMGGDPRETNGAQKRVQQLLEEFPLKRTADGDVKVVFPPDVQAEIDRQKAAGEKAANDDGADEDDAAGQDDTPQLTLPQEAAQ